MILLCFGTRPEWLKIKPLIQIMNKAEYKLLFTGQHPDLLGDVKVDYQIEIQENENRLDQLISDCLLQFPQGEFTSVLIQGDTASAFACALAAFHRKLKIYYLEAGLRSYDLEHPYPEEGYRQMISRLANVNFTPTVLSYENLVGERVPGKIYLTGNTVLDNLLPYKSRCTYLNSVLVTLHRRENHPYLAQWFTEINNLAVKHPDLEFILPVHLNPNVQKHKQILKNVKVVTPLEYADLLELLLKCKLVITDSGGLQEEGSFFNKKVIVCRKVTERPEAIATGHLHLCKSPAELEELFDTLREDYYIDSKCPYGDGTAAKNVLNYIRRESNF